MNLRQMPKFIQMIRKIVCLSILMSLLSPCLGWGGYDYQFDTRMVKHGQFESEISAKLSRGITNVLLGWTELIKTPIETADPIDDGVIKAVFVGIPYGISRFVARTLVGVFEIATFYAPQKPIMRPIEGDVV